MTISQPSWSAKLIFDSAWNQVIDYARKSALRRRRGTTKRSFGVDQASAIWRKVGGRATPRAESARLAAGRGAERSRKRLPSCSTSVSVSESRSAMTAGQEARAPCRRGEAGLQLGLQHEREEAAGDVAADGLVELVEDRPGGEQILGRPERLLHGPELFVDEHRLKRREIRVGAQHEHAIEVGILLDPFAVDGEAVALRVLEEAAIAVVADEALSPFFSCRSSAATMVARSAASFSSR